MDSISIKTSETQEVIGKAIKQALSLAYDNMPQFDFYIIVQGDQGGIGICRGLLSNDKVIENQRFVFISTNITDPTFLFWEKTLTDLGLGSSFESGEDNIFSVFSRLC